MSDALKQMDDNLFRMHANEQKNDFAKWVKDVFKNEALAAKLSDAKSRAEMANILEVYL